MINYILNQTTNTRFSKNRRNHVSDAQMAALAEDDSSYEEDYSAPTSFKAPTSMMSRDGTLNEHTSGSPLGDCSRMIWGSRSKRPDKFMKKIMRDPNKQINQPMTSQTENMQQHFASGSRMRVVPASLS